MQSISGRPCHVVVLRPRDGRGLPKAQASISNPSAWEIELMATWQAGERASQTPPRLRFLL